ncbi:hypothetical protein HK099_001907, partial [Clydaea vesicula]
MQEFSIEEFLNQASKILDQHLHSAINNDDKMTCQYCFLDFKRKYDLKRHEKKHLNIKDFVCNRCMRGFTRSDALKNHTDNRVKCKFLLDRRRKANK